MYFIVIQDVCRADLFDDAMHHFCVDLCHIYAFIKLLHNIARQTVYSAFIHETS